MAMIRRSDKENNHSYLYLSALDHQLARMAGMSAPRAQQAPANADYRAASRRSSVKADVVRVMESIRSDGSRGQGIPSASCSVKVDWRREEHRVRSSVG